MNIAHMLYTLQTIEVELGDKSRRLEEVRVALKDTKKLDEARRAVQDSEAELARWQAQQRDQELEMKSVTGKIGTVEKRLYSGTVRNPKELANLEEELNYLRRRKNALEDELLETMVAVDESQAELKKRRQCLTEVEAEWEASQVALTAERAALKAQLEQLKSEQAELRAEIGEKELSLYQQLRRKKGGRGVALLKGGVCQGCGMALPTSKAQQVRQGDTLVFCSCGRILYAAH